MVRSTRRIIVGFRIIIPHKHFTYPFAENPLIPHKSFFTYAPKQPLRIKKTEESKPKLPRLGKEVPKHVRLCLWCGQKGYKHMQHKDIIATDIPTIEAPASFLPLWSMYIVYWTTAHKVKSHGQYQKPWAPSYPLIPLSKLFTHRWIRSDDIHPICPNVSLP